MWSDEHEAPNRGTGRDGTSTICVQGTNGRGDL
jgi:hypothetical protein